MFGGEVGVLHAGIDRDQGPFADLLVRLQFVLRARRAGSDGGTAVRDARDEPHHHGNVQLFRQLERLENHVVAFLLVARLQAGNQRELGEIAAVLLVLGGVHARVVRHRQHKAAVGARDRGVHEGIGRHVEPDVFHAHQRALTGPTHAKRLFVGDFFVGRPEGVDVAVLTGALLDEFEDFGRGGSGIAVNPAQAGVDRAETDGLVAEKNFSVHVCPVRRQGSLTTKQV